MPRLRPWMAVLIALAVAEVLAACGAGATPAEPSATATLSRAPESTVASEASSLLGTEWVLASLQGKPPLPETEIHLRFEGDRFSSYAGCNTLAGRYAAAEPGTFSHPELELTMEFCPGPEGVMEQEQSYVEAFGSSVTYRLSEERLELLDATGQAVLVYERMSSPAATDPLSGTKWVLSSLRDQPVLPGTVINLEFGDQSLGGYAGCNFYNAVHRRDQPGPTGEGTLEFSGFEVTLIGCPEEIAAQEEAYLEALWGGVSYQVTEARLELRDGTGETVLVYNLRAECAEEPASLEGSAWQLVSVDNQSPAEGSATWLAFVDDQWFVEYSECEGYISSYQVSGYDLDAAFSANLGRICEDEESHRATPLEAPADTCLEEGELQITTTRGGVFTYEALPEAAQQPLEGPTWSLLSMVGARQIEGEAVPWPDPAWLVEGSQISVIFEGGAASGSAGCNGYGTGYALDGTALSFGEIAATEKDCPTPEGVMEQEQRYLDALQDVTSYRIYGILLWLWTADGRGLAFIAAGAQ